MLCSNMLAQSLCNCTILSGSSFFSSTMSLSKLNYDCSLGVLAGLPLSKQLAFRLVCNTWCTTIETQLCRRRSLAVIDKGDCWSSRVYKHTPLTAFYFVGDPLWHRSRKLFRTRNLLPILSRLFPSVEQIFLFLHDRQYRSELPPMRVPLIISFRNMSSYSHLTGSIKLDLSHLSGSLSSLAFLYSTNVNWAQLANIPTLKRLFCWSLSGGFVKISDLAPVLGQLEYFAAGEVLSNVLLHFGPHLRWLQIHQLHLGDFWEPMEVYLNELIEHLKVSPMRHSLQHLSIGSIPVQRLSAKVNLLETICTTLCNLKTFHFLDDSVRWH